MFHYVKIDVENWKISRDILETVEIDCKLLLLFTNRKSHIGFPFLFTATTESGDLE